MTFHIRWQILIILFGIVLVGVLLTYLATNYTTVLQPGRGGTYVEGVEGFPRFLNPLLCTHNDVDRSLCSLLFNGLTRINGRGEIEADLARAWEVSDNGLDYTFYLRSDAYWHDGTPVTADDVIFTFKLMQDPEFPGPIELGAAVWQTVTLERVSALIVRFTLAEPYAPFLDHTAVGILPFHLLAGVRAAELTGIEFNLSPVGTGPFQLEEVGIHADTITSLVLTQAARQRGPSIPYLSRLQFRFYPSHQTALNAYEAGEVEAVSRVLPADLPRARALPSLNLFSARLSEYATILLNFRRPELGFFQEAEVRQAMLYALDRQHMVDEVLAGQALVAHGPLIPGTWAYDDQVIQYQHNPDKASEILDEAHWYVQAVEPGIRRKEGQDIVFALLASSEPDHIEVAHLAAEAWVGLSMSVTVVISSPLEVRKALERRDFDAILVRMAMPGDPDPYPFWHETQIEDGQNYSGLTHRRISEILEQARVISSRERRRDLYYQFQEVFAEEVLALPLYVPVYTYGVDERVHDVQIAPLTDPSDRFRTISDWWIVPRRVFVSEPDVG